MLLSFFVYIEMYYFLMAGNLFLKHKVKHVYFYALILLIPYLLVPFIGQVPAFILMNIIFIIVYKTRGNSWIRTLASYLLPITITNLVQSLISLTPLLNKDNPGVNLSLVLPIIISFSFAYLFMKALIYCYQKYKHKIEGLYKNIYFKVAIGFFIVGIIFLEIYGNIIIKKYLQLEQYLPPALIFFIYLVLLTLAMLSIAYAGIHAAKKKAKEKQYRELEGYTSHLEDLHRNISGFKHDYVNILSSLMGYIESQDYKGLENHLIQVIAPYSQQIMVENQSFSALMMVKIPALKGLLTVKLLEIYRLELNHRVEIIEPVETIHMDLVDLSRMLGILLDNAIEAAALSQEKHLGLALIKSPQGLTIIVENTYSEDILPIHEMYEERKSTKGPSRGLGLYHYKAMAKAYSHVLTETFIENKVFKQVLTIYDQK